MPKITIQSRNPYSNGKNSPNKTRWIDYDSFDSEDIDPERLLKWLRSRSNVYEYRIKPKTNND